jgi:hypothetical protein
MHLDYSSGERLTRFENRTRENGVVAFTGPDSIVKRGKLKIIEFLTEGEGGIRASHHAVVESLAFRASVSKMRNR